MAVENLPALIAPGSTHLLAANLAVLPARSCSSASDSETTYAHRDRRATFHTLVAAHL